METTRPSPPPEFEIARGATLARLETTLRQTLERAADTPVRRAAQYAVHAGGRRWRGLLTVAAGQLFDAHALETAMPCACAVELAHTASLVLDDLPSMDNAQLRRGKPCVHLAFPRWAADLTPVFLITLAYQVCLDNPHAAPDRRAAAALALSAAGLQMTHGQALDLTTDREASAEAVLQCHVLKTGALSAAAAKTGAIVCGAAPACAEQLESFGRRLGLAYQILDDLADGNGSPTMLGKQTHMDAAKVTALDLFGAEGARRKVRDLAAAALAEVEAFGREAAFLRGLVAWNAGAFSGACS